MLLLVMLPCSIRYCRRKSFKKGDKVSHGERLGQTQRLSVASLDSAVLSAAVSVTIVSAVILKLQGRIREDPHQRTLGEMRGKSCNGSSRKDAASNFA
jgi:hypothetical protein